jgi:uncharacterized repeat protein (TIGR01451 family)
MKLFKAIIAFSFISLVLPGVVSADTNSNCTPVYGGGSSCNQTGLIIDKKVKHPQNNSFVDNLTVNDPKYNPDQPITFRISITNSGTTELKPLTVTDTLPAFLTGVSGPGSFDAGKNIVTFTVASLKGKTSLPLRSLH